MRNIMASGTVAPCYQCIDKTMGCHSHCLRYGKYAQDREVARVNTRKDLDLSSVIKRGMYRRGI